MKIYSFLSGLHIILGLKLFDLFIYSILGLLHQQGRYGKINKCITFPELLDMVPFMTGTGDSPPLYMLYGVVVHLDTQNASFSGHYVSYVKDMQGTWFRVDDVEVNPSVVWLLTYSLVIKAKWKCKF